MKHQEHVIRPMMVESEYRELLLQEIKTYFFESQTGQPKKDILVYVRCPACDQDHYDFFMEKDGFALQSCRGCGLIFVNPRPTEAVQMDFFSRSRAMSLYSEMVEMTKTARVPLIFIPLVELILDRYGTEKRNLLEVGCGSGLLLEVLTSKNLGWSLKGVEPSERAVEICRKKGLDVFHGCLEQLDDENEYDLIIFWAVFDHFFDPFSVVEKTYQLLKPGGSIIIGNINIDGFDSMVLSRDNTAFAPPERQNFYGITSMQSMLERAGFTDIKINTTGKLDVDIIRNYWQSGKTNGRTAFLEKIVFGSQSIQELFQSFLIQNNLSGHMTVTAVK